jgi:Rho-binding antiterminator
MQYVSCDTHDYLEVACLYRYELDLTLRDGTELRGRAVDIRTAVDAFEGKPPGKSEHLVLEGETGRFSVPLSELQDVRVTTPGARFHSVDIVLEGERA